jgi:hypothetical protein
MDTKQCFNCKKHKPLTKFAVDRRKYQLPPDKGRCKVCIACDKEKSLRLMETIYFCFDTNRFQTRVFKNKKDVVDYYKQQVLLSSHTLNYK